MFLWGMVYNKKRPRINQHGDWSNMYTKFRTEMLQQCHLDSVASKWVTVGKQQGKSRAALGMRVYKHANVTPTSPNHEYIYNLKTYIYVYINIYAYTCAHVCIYIYIYNKYYQLCIFTFLRLIVG